MIDMLSLAAKVSLPTDTIDPRNFWLGCVGIRRDGVIVSAKNGAVFSTTVDNYQLMPGSHAEVRTLRKLGKGGTMFVARVARGDKSLAMARPCPMCQTIIRSNYIKKVYYTINDQQYGIWLPMVDQDKIFNL